MSSEADDEPRKSFIERLLVGPYGTVAIVLLAGAVVLLAVVLVMGLSVH